jgi:ABC-type glycerol-3-phosphate transport system permease component
MTRQRTTRRWTRWAVSAVALAVALAVAVPFVYINLIQSDTPDRLGVASA